MLKFRTLTDAFLRRGHRVAAAKMPLALLFKSFQLLLMVMISATAASAQFDRAKDEPLRDVRKYYEEVLRYAEQGNRDSAKASLYSLLEDDKALDTLIEFTKDVPGQLNDGGLREIADKAKVFLETAIIFRNVGGNLREKINRVGENYSSELSTFKDKHDDFERRFAEFNEALLRATGAIKKACPGCWNN